MCTQDWKKHNWFDKDLVCGWACMWLNLYVFVCVCVCVCVCVWLCVFVQDKVANFWCSLSVVIKLKQLLSLENIVLLW